MWLTPQFPAFPETGRSVNSETPDVLRYRVWRFPEIPDVSAFDGTFEPRRAIGVPTGFPATGIFWVQIPNKDNHFFDTHVYGMTALELIAENYCLNELGLVSLDWGDFWLYVGDRYYTQIDNSKREKKEKKNKKS